MTKKEARKAIVRKMEDAKTFVSSVYGVAKFYGLSSDEANLSPIMFKAVAGKKNGKLLRQEIMKAATGKDASSGKIDLPGSKGVKFVLHPRIISESK